MLLDCRFWLFVWLDGQAVEALTPDAVSRHDWDCGRPRRPIDDMDHAMDYSALVVESLDDAAVRLEMLGDHLQNAEALLGGPTDKTSTMRGITADTRAVVLRLKAAAEKSNALLSDARDGVLEAER